MRAAFIDAIGPADSIRVGEIATPEPGPGQVRVRVGAAAINPIDLYIRSGVVAMPIPLPYVIGCDLAGTVDAVGPGTSRFQVGDRVWGSNQGLFGRQGATSELAVVDEPWLYPTPATLTDVEAAALALVGITAHLGLFACGRLSAGETVYVAGGSGGVGSMVIQMAKAAGAHVATTAGTPEHVALCQSLGADLALNYREDDVPAALRAFREEGIDVWYETQREPNFEVSVPLLRKRGRMIVMAGRTAKPTLPLGNFYTRNCSLHGFAMFNATAEEQQRCSEDMNRWVTQGQLRPLVGQTFPLEQAAEAHRFLEESTLGNASKVHGKVVITIS